MSKICPWVVPNSERFRGAIGLEQDRVLTIVTAVSRAFLSGPWRTQRRRARKAGR